MTPQHIHQHAKPKSKKVLAVKVAFVCLFMSMVCIGALQLIPFLQSSTSTPVDLKKSLTVDGEIGAPVVLKINTPVLVNQVISEKFITSKNTYLRKNMPVLLAVTTYNARTGENTSGPFPKLIDGALREDLVEEHIYKQLLKTRVSERLVTYLPTKENSRLVGEISVIDVLPMQASGKSIKDENLPVDVDFVDFIPVISDLKYKPSEPTIYTLIQGNGAQIHKNSEPIVNYIVKEVNSGKILESTYTDGIPKKLSLSKTYKAIGDLLVDTQVGSRVLLYLPDDQTDGKMAMIMLIDILALENG